MPRSPLNVVQMPANANSGRGLGVRRGAYSAKLLAGTKHRCSGVNQMRQCGDDMLRIFVTGGAPVRSGGGMPPRIIAISLPVSVLRITGAG